MDYTKSTKADLLSALASLEQEKTTALAMAEHNAKIANWFQQVLESLEALLINSPFINTKGKFFRKLFWVIANFATITTFIESVFTQLKTWRDEVTKIQTAIETAKANIPVNGTNA